MPGHEKLPVLRLPTDTPQAEEFSGHTAPCFTHLAECINLLYQTDGIPQWSYLPTLPETVPLEVVAQMQRGNAPPEQKETTNHAIP